jgi:putative peptidoglycan lipid II flippase
MWTEGKRDEMASTSNYYLRLNLYVCVAAAVGLYCLAEPIVELLFQRGKFTPAEAATTAGVVKVYSFLIISNSLVRVFVPSYYAVKNTWFPALISSICLVIHVIIAPRLMDRYGLYGLNSSAVITSTLNFLLLAGFYRRFVGVFGWGRVLKSFGLFLIPGLVMALGLQLYPWLRSALGDGFFAKLISLAVAIGWGASIYALLSRLLKLEEFSVTFEAVMGKIRRRLRRS